MRQHELRPSTESLSVLQQGRQGQTGQVAGVYGCWMADRNLEQDAAYPQPR